MLVLRLLLLERVLSGHRMFCVFGIEVCVSDLDSIGFGFG